MRQEYAIFRSSGDVTVTFGGMSGGGMTVTYEASDGSRALVLINPNASDTTHTLTGQWMLMADGQHAGTTLLSVESGSVTVPARSVRIYTSELIAAEWTK